ncbi:MAG TPA: CHAD domain-containing protein, partial [Nitratifractor sp.]|nr:CHAD domain-containing protein [Nitratifractor sp.]
MKDLDYSLLVNVLQQYVKDIEFYHQRFLDSKDDEDLHQFRVNLRKSRALLKAFRKSFQSQKLLKKVIKNLAYIAKKSNKTRDMDIFLQACRDSFRPFVSMLP